MSKYNAVTCHNLKIYKCLFLTDYIVFFLFPFHEHVCTHIVLDFMHLIVLTEIPLKLLFWNNLTSKQRNTVGLLKSSMCSILPILQRAQVFFGV